MPLLEKIISVVAPHECIGCSAEDTLLCSHCSRNVVMLPPRCYHCGSLCRDWRTCKSCRSQRALRSVYVRTTYEDIAKELIYQLKFQRARSAAKPIAELMMECCMPEAKNMLIMPVPTATVRSRQRGYDQSELIARLIADNASLELSTQLRRHGQTRQVGTKRAQRLKQLTSVFWVTDQRYIAGKDILLVDDVLTTGATVESAARTLRDAGARHVDAAVFAQTLAR